MGPNPTSPRDGRRLTLGDLMVLVGAPTLGLAACQAVVRTMLDGQTSLVDLLRIPDVWTAPDVALRAINLVGLALTVFGPWTFLLPILRLRRPRPRWRRLTLQPGLTACLAATFGMALSLAVIGLTLFTRGFMPAAWGRTWFDWLRLFLLDELVGYAGVSVASAWSLQALSGRWRPTPDAIDRLGRAVGVLWIVAGVTWGVRRYVFLP